MEVEVEVRSVGMGGYPTVVIFLVCTFRISLACNIGIEISRLSTVSCSLCPTCMTQMGNQNVTHTLILRMLFKREMCVTLNKRLNSASINIGTYKL